MPGKSSDPLAGNFRDDPSALQAPSKETEWREGHLAANSINIRYHETIPAKNGLPKLVFLHGLCACGPVLIPLFSDLSEDYHVFLPDARGHGGSTPIPEGSFTMDNLVADAAAAIRYFSPDAPVFLGGHSMGASTAARVARLHPELIKAVTLEDPPWLRAEGAPVAPLGPRGPPGPPGPPGIPQGGVAGRGRGRVGGRGWSPFNDARRFQALSDEEFAQLDNESGSLPKFANTMAQSLRTLEWQKVEPTFPETDDVINEAVNGIQVPVLLQTGLPTGVCKAEVAKDVVATWPQGNYKNWEGAGHVIHKQKQPYLAELRDFFMAAASD